MRSFLSVHIDFPALSELVAFLRERDQSKIDALTAQVAEVTSKLHQSSSDLQGSVDTKENQ